MARKKKEDQLQQIEAPPPPLFLGKKERDLVKQINDEVIERVIGQTVIYYPIDLETTNFHPLYGESLQKTFLSPIRVHALVEWAGYKTTTDKFSIDRRPTVKVMFHKRRLTEDQNLFVREGDFILYGDTYYEIVTLNEPKQLFGQIDNRFEIEAECIKAREGVFNAK
jgi:hypothetical protein